MIKRGGEGVTLIYGLINIKNKTGSPIAFSAYFSEVNTTDELGYISLDLL